MARQVAKRAGWMALGAAGLLAVEPVAAYAVVYWGARRWMLGGR